MFPGLGDSNEPGRASFRTGCGELDSGRSVVYCVADGRLTGAILINANDAMDECRKLMRERPTIDELLDRLGPEGSAEMVNTGAG